MSTSTTKIDNPHKYVPGGTRFSQSTYLGRLKLQFTLCNPFSLRYSKNKILEFKQILDDVKEGKPTKYSDKELWDMQTICSGSIHPQTGLVIPKIWRTSSFSLTNLPISAGFALSPHTLPWIVFWQTVNQTYNAGFNFANRNASSDSTSLAPIIKSYLGALCISVGTALSLNALSKFVTRPSLAFIATKVIPYIAVASAGSANVLLMRSSDFLHGIEVKDDYGNNYGLSKKAGINVMRSVVLSRVVLPIPSVLIPPMLLHYFKKFKICSNPKVKFFLDLTTCFVLLSFAMPIAISLFPSQIKVNVNKLEPEFQRLKDKNGNPISYLIADKGV